DAADATATAVLFYRYGDPRDARSFPTRRSSDLSRQEMGILSKRLLVLALSDVTRNDDDLAPIRITAWEFAQLFNIRGKSIYSRRSEEHTSELQSRENLVCRLLLEKKKRITR